ncbi:MAG: efflux RND transporter permease subunit [Candidatus Eisenbacteria sp.]|nr:efflux RND transporter permease subunit [Candidatus Eisenbacteria bacterium]
MIVVGPKAPGAARAGSRKIPGAVDVRHDLGLGAPTVRFKVDDAAAGRHGLSRSDLALALLRQTRGLEIGQFRAGDDPVPIYLRSAAGEAEGSGETNTAMMVALPWGILLLLGILLGEFNSFRRVGIILVTVPLAAAGVVPGLIIAGQPFGFMSLLGVIALVGIVVNNAIVLLDRIERRRREGASIADAVSDGVRRRIRPILLTTITTVAGLLPLALSGTTLWPPLALSGTTLWPPLAWAMISGLLASTMLALWSCGLCITCC